MTKRILTLLLSAILLFPAETFAASVPIGGGLNADADGNLNINVAAGVTQYNQGTASTSTDTMTMAGCVRADTAAVDAGVADGDRVRCIVDSTGRLWVNVGNTVLSAGTAEIGNVKNSGTFATQATLQAGTAEIGKLAAGTAEIGKLAAGTALIGKVGIDQTTPGTTNRVDIGTFPDNEPFNMAQIGGVATSMGVGASDTGTQRLVMATNDPCQSSGVAKSSVVLNVTANAELIAASGSTKIYVCGFFATVGGTTPTYRFVYGTGTTCGTGTTFLTGLILPVVGSFNVYAPGMTAFATTASQALCMAVGGTSPSVQGTVTYVQQ